jgi:hypothetical protein
MRYHISVESTKRHHPLHPQPRPINSSVLASLESTTHACTNLQARIWNRPCYCLRSCLAYSSRETACIRHSSRGTSKTQTCCSTLNPLLQLAEPPPPPPLWRFNLISSASLSLPVMKPVHLRAPAITPVSVNVARQLHYSRYAFA